MENIIEPNDLFQFANLSLMHPTGVQGGAYFTKIQYNNKPLYIQTTKSLSRQGFVKSGKKYYCDLMFDQNSVTLINWFEKLEETCQKLIYEKSDTWFQNALEMSDVESAFNSIIRIYKSGKFYLVRTNIKSSSLTSDPAVKIYNENEIPVPFQDITNETNLISILEIQGIKFTSRNFQIEIELKQIMVVDNEPIFESCLIKTSKKETIKKNEMIENPLDTLDTLNNLDNLDNLENIMDEPTQNETVTTNDIPNNDISKDVTFDDTTNDTNVKNDTNTEQMNESLTIDIEELESEAVEEIKEIHLEPLENNLETMTLKKPNQVYFELYKEARNKAKQAKKSLILAYLEAKNIKKTYMLDNLNDSDSDLDAEIDEMSESELDGF
jgi:hypothetical protein